MKLIELNEAQAKLKKIHQQHLLQYWESLSKSQQISLLAQIDKLSISTFVSQKKLLEKKPAKVQEQLTAFDDIETKGSLDDYQLGKQLIASGQMGCLIVAGGQGTRLKFDEPKGLFPVTIVKHKTLFQLFAEKVQAASIQAGRPLLLAIMTSSVNHEQIINYFKKNDFFGLQSNQVSFFSQGNLPLIKQNGDLFLEDPANIAEGPDGNGSSLQNFVEQGIWDEWHRLGVRYLNFVMIDNPLADPFDAELVGFASRQQADLVLKCVERKDPKEKVGVIVKNEGKAFIMEYTEMSPFEFNAFDSDGRLKHRFANISLFSFGMDFAKDVVKLHYKEMPFHKSLKAVKYLDVDGLTKKANDPFAWKFEKFIFDVLPFAKKVKALLYPREETFGPLKNFSGMDSLIDVQSALQNLDRLTYFRISGLNPPSTPFELDPQFYYPTQDLLAYWRERPLPSSPYVKANVK